MEHKYRCYNMLSGIVQVFYAGSRVNALMKARKYFRTSMVMIIQQAIQIPIKNVLSWRSWDVKLKCN